MRTTDSVDRVVSVLELLAETPDGLGVSEVADALGVHKTTGSRLLGTLAARGLLERDPVTRRYWLGTGIVGLAGAAIARLRVVSQARPELERLSALTSETVNLAILNGRHVVYVDQVTPRQAVVMANWVGRRSPAHASSSGKVLLAFGDELVRRAVLSHRLEQLTPRTVTDKARLGAILASARRQGYVRSSGELEEGLVTIAAPVLVHGRAVAAVSVSGPSFRIPARDQPHLAHLAIDAATAVGRRIGGEVTP
ncbi:MAG TPA: IclR family transcriptional regulator [Actinomycetota bacterium]|nr:IclR family transcriptional regulator [Actinomycetota bacterium]